LLPSTSHFSKKNISFNDSGYVIKPPQRSSAVYGAPPFTSNQHFSKIWICSWQRHGMSMH